MSSRLRMQGYVVEEVSDPLLGAKRALESPPAAVVSDLWMSGLSGAQLWTRCSTAPPSRPDSPSRRLTRAARPPPPSSGR
jgi:CheY-like chemotaxis protein